MNSEALILHRPLTKDDFEKTKNENYTKISRLDR